MAESEVKATGKDKSVKGSWFQGLKAEFNKIIWTDKKDLVRQTIAVVVVTALLALIIAVLDSAVLGGLNLILK